MKKNLLYFLILLFLGAGIYFLVIKKPWGTLKVDETAFAIDDTAAIGKIFIADMQGQKITLDRNKDFWVVNQKYQVRNDFILSLLSTLKNISVNRPVPDAAQSNVLKEMASHNRRVEVYDREGKLIKAYNVGGASLDALGTYMLMDGAKKAYVLSIPGFMGVLQTRYSTDEQEIRTSTIYQYRINEIKELSVQYTGLADSSFTISVFGPDSFLVKNGNGISLIKDQYNRDKILAYLTNYKFVSAEVFANELTVKDTILQTTPYCIISVTDKNNKTFQTVIYNMPRTQRTVIQFDRDGNPVKNDKDRYFATINSGNDFVIIQLYHFGRLFKNFSYFVPQKIK